MSQFISVMFVCSSFILSSLLKSISARTLNEVCNKIWLDSIAESHFCPHY